VIKRLKIKNFKCFRDSELEFGKVNIVVGSNGAGKTNLVDAFSFLKQVIKPTCYPPLRFIRWGEYKNLVFMQDENQDISLEIDGEYQGEDYHYEISVSKSRIKKEIMNFDSYSIERIGNVMRYESMSMKIPDDLSVSSLLSTQSSTKESDFNSVLSPKFLDFVENLLNDVGVFRIVPQMAASPVYHRFPGSLDEDGHGLADVINSNLFRIPEVKQVYDFLVENNIYLRPVLEKNKYVRLNFIVRNEDNKELILPSASVPDGFIKMLTILTAVYLLKMSTIVIDEIENSLHLKYIERLVDVIRHSDSQFIATTHSPLIIDFMDPSEIIILDKERGETKVSKVQEPEKLKEKLAGNSILLSEWLLY
jgi:AAA15 family ATPase/GTPase